MAFMSDYYLRPGPLTRDEALDRSIYARRLSPAPFPGAGYIGRVNPLAIEPTRMAESYAERSEWQRRRVLARADLYAVDHTDTHGVWAFYTAGGRRYAIAPTLNELVQMVEQDGILFPEDRTRGYRNRWSSIRMPRRITHTRTFRFE